ncbi:cupin domain-containing protein [Endozoicomonas ascidiicola]|uniref:cupin domain-containing protein n=1 Tax=Endozoicomonas ascidiicola TaxID=1698521 RepID=UPI0008371A90|nr:cupin domain-containing protein [Endozoicomonas ascidiicola]
MTMRQIITGHDANGKSVFVSVAQVTPVEGKFLPGLQSFELWSTAQTPEVPVLDPTKSPFNYFPELGGSVFRVISFPPQVDGKTEINPSEEAVAELMHKLPGLVEHLELDNPGMHTTNSVDYGIVLSGEICLELDDGQEQRLKAGDCVIQNGTRHAWHNKSNTPAVMAFVLLGAKRT